MPKTRVYPYNPASAAELSARFPDGMHSKNSAGQLPLTILMMEKPTNGWLISACLAKSIEARVDFNTKDLAGNSPLKIALIHGMPEDFLENLIQNGKADPNYNDRDAYHFAKEKAANNKDDPMVLRYENFCKFAQGYLSLAPAERSEAPIHSSGDIIERTFPISEAFLDPNPGCHCVIC